MSGIILWTPFSEEDRIEPNGLYFGYKVCPTCQNDPDKYRDYVQFLFGAEYQPTKIDQEERSRMGPGKATRYKFLLKKVAT